MGKKYFFGVFIVSLLGCMPSLEQDTRILVKGALVDQEGLPISNAEIKVSTRISSGGSLFYPSPTGSDEFILGHGHSDANGDFSIVSLFDTREVEIFIDENEAYSNYYYVTSFQNYTPENLTVSLGVVTLQDLSIFNYEITRLSQEGTTLDYIFRYVDVNCVEHYVEGVLDLSLSSCNEDRFIDRQLNDYTPNINSSFKVPMGTDVEFTYSINQGQEFTQIITINQTNYDFSFTY